MDFLKKFRGSPGANRSIKGSAASSASASLRLQCNSALRAGAAQWASLRPIRILSMTYNVASETPPSEESISHWFRWQTGASGSTTLFGDVDDIPKPRLAPPLPEAIFVGLQEVDMSARSILLEGSSDRCRAWVSALCGAVSHWAGNSAYTLVVSDQLVGLATLLWIRSDVLSQSMWADVRVCRVRFGAGGILGNKGAVGIRLCMYSRTFLLLNCHFVPDPANHEKRCANFHAVFAGVDFPARDVARVATSATAQKAASSKGADAAGKGDKVATPTTETPTASSVGGGWSPTKGAASTFVHHLPYVDPVWRALRPGSDLTGIPSAAVVACDGPSHCSGPLCKVCGDMSAAVVATAAAASAAGGGKGSAKDAEGEAAGAAVAADGTLAMTTTVASAYDYVVLIGDVNVRLDTTDTAAVQKALTAAPPDVKQLASLDQLRRAQKSGAAFCVKRSDTAAVGGGGGAVSSAAALVDDDDDDDDDDDSNAPTTENFGGPSGAASCGDAVAVSYLKAFVDSSDLHAVHSAEAVYAAAVPPSTHSPFCEAPLLFRPGYKYLEHSAEYDYSSKKGIPRIPSWTDRILTLAKPSGGGPSSATDLDTVLLPHLAPAAVTTSYRCVHGTLTSDHRPVIAQLVFGGIAVNEHAVFRILKKVTALKEGCNAAVSALSHVGRGDCAPHICKARLYD